MRAIFLLFALLTPFASIAQKQANIWYFGQGQGLDFSTGTPTIISGGQTGHYKGNTTGQEGTSCISDANGKLLFYTGGICIWNRFHKIMQHGDSLYGGNSSVQSSVIVPKPGSSSVFYVFTAGERENLGTSKRGYRYTVVDMCLDSNRGDVAQGQKNILLADSSSERITACKASNGDPAYWILGQAMQKDSFFAWKLTSAGVSNAIISQVGYRDKAATGGCAEMKLSPLGTKLAISHTTTNPAIVEILDFNSATGVLTNPCQIKIDSGGVTFPNVRSLEFSPDGTKLYASVAPQAIARKIYQYNLNAGGGNCDSVIASKYVLFSSKPIGSNIAMSMQTASDGKIYVIDDLTRIGRIDHPNSLGAAAGYDSMAVVVTTGGTGNALPNFVAGLNYSNGVPPCLQPSGIENIEHGITVMVYPNPTGASTTLALTLLSPLVIKITLTDMQGREVWAAALRSYRAGKSEADIPMHSLVSGQYFYRLSDNKGQMLASGAVVKQ